MKKIYMIMAAIALLSLSLNAQLLPEFQKLKTNPTQFTELRNGQHNNVSSSTTSNHGKSMRAPLKALSDGEYYVGPYTTDDFSNNGLGFGNQYNQDQSILLGVILNRSEFEEHLGEEIVGFRFALAGSGQLPVFEFAMLPYHDDGSSIYFDQDNMKEWGMEEWNQPTTTTSTVTFNQANDYGTTSVTKDDVTISCTSGNLAQSYNQYRFYANSTTTISTSSGTITRIEFTGVRNYAVSNWSASTGTLTPSGNNGTWTGNASSVNFTCTSQVRCTEIVVTVTNTSTPTYQILNCGQWHEYRLAEPVEFNVASDVTKLYLGYSYYQQVSGSTDFELYPIAYNPNSTGHDHMALMYADASSTSVPNYQRSWWLWNFPGDLSVQLIFKSNKIRPDAPTVTNQVNDDNVVITITPDPNTDGDLVYYVDNNGNHVQDLTFPRGETAYTVTVHAYTEETDDYFESPEAVVTVTIPPLQTATPVITTTTNADGSVTVTATGAGTVTLTIGDQTVQDQGEASITLPQHMSDYTVTATATAKENGKAVSETATEEVTVTGMGGGDWLPMDGTYNNPNDLLSFEYQGKEIMLIDQFLESTFDNEHPDGYTYTLRETINNEEKSSNAVNIPVYKTNSSIQGLYTKAQIDEDTDMHLKANAINSEMDYYVHPDRNTLYHSLYRGDKNAAYPVIDVPHRISQLQKFDELVGDQVQYFFFENHQEDIMPMYDHLGTGIAERVDTDYVIGQAGDELSYVPVIWTFGLYTARGDGKNNSYGSDIKRETLGDVTVQISGSRSGGDNLEEATHNGWEGLFKVGDEYYCIYTPIITINGITPAEKVQNDGDVSTYVPYMYRAWCLYESARDFKHVMQDNGNGTMVGVLTDNGPLTIPYLLGTEVTENTIGHIGTAWTGGPRLQWAFGVPFDENPANVPIAVRFYYKKTVNEVAANNMRTANRDGDDENSEEYYIVEVEGSAKDIETAINEFYYGKAIVGITYVNAQGMKSDKPFDGLNIIVTRYSDGTTSTTKVIK